MDADLQAKKQDIDVIDTSLDVIPVQDNQLKIPPKEINKKRNFDVAKALELRLKNKMSYADIGKLYSVSKQWVHFRLRKFAAILDNPNTLESLESVRGSVLTAVEFKLLETLLDSDKLKSASLNNVAYAFEQIFKARKLDAGEPTQLIGVVHITPEEALTLRRNSAVDADRIIREGSK